MDEKSFKKLLNESLVPIQKDLTELKQAQGIMKQSQDGMMQAQNKMNQTQDKMMRAQEKIQDTLDNRVIPSITETEMTVKSYADSYKENQHNIERVDTRLTAVEENIGIETPEHLKVPHFAE